MRTISLSIFLYHYKDGKCNMDDTLLSLLSLTVYWRQVSGKLEKHTNKNTKTRILLFHFIHIITFDSIHYVVFIHFKIWPFLTSADASLREEEVVVIVAPSLVITMAIPFGSTADSWTMRLSPCKLSNNLWIVFLSTDGREGRRDVYSNKGSGEMS